MNMTKALYALSLVGFAVIAAPSSVADDANTECGAPPSYYLPTGGPITKPGYSGIDGAHARTNAKRNLANEMGKLSGVACKQCPWNEDCERHETEQVPEDGSSGVSTDTPVQNPMTLQWSCNATFTPNGNYWQIYCEDCDL